MNLDELKGKTLDDETFGKLKQYTDDLIGQRDAARNESINGRKSLKAKAEAYEAALAKALEKLGIDSADDLETLPDAKGQGEAIKQLEARAKRMERERDDAVKARDEAANRFRQSQQKAIVAEALGAHDFVARDMVETFISNRLEWNGDDVMFKADDGKLIPVKDGVAGVAKTRPELLKSQGAGGAGIRQANAGGSGGKQTITRSAYDAMSHAQRAALDWKAVEITD